MRLFTFLSLLLAAASLSGCRFEPANATAGKTVEVAVFEGGFGIEWHKAVAREYEKLHPGIRIHLWGDPRVDEKLKPRILRGNPPDVANAILPVWKLIVAGKLYPLDEALDSPAYHQPGTWRQSLMSGVLASYEYKGKVYAMPTDFGAWACWFDRRLFRKHGWRPPETWEEFRALCKAAKAKGLGPVAFQGKYPIYAWQTLLNLYQRIAAPRNWYDIQNLKPGAFTEPGFVRAATLLQELASEYHQPGAAAMSHTESQLEWVNGRAAMVFCGLWLSNEMKEALPKEFEIDCFALPRVEGGQGDPNGVIGGGGAQFFVFKEGRHPREGADFMKFLTSRANAISYIETLSSLSVVKGASNGARLPEGLQGAVKIVNQASGVFTDRLASLYLEFGTKTLPAELALLMGKKIEPKEFCRRLETEAEGIRRNADLYKPPPMEAPVE